jgi:hypothetical protein
VFDAWRELSCEGPTDNQIHSQRFNLMREFFSGLTWSDILTTCSILIALLTWHISHRRDRRAKRVEYTAEVISALSTSERLAESSFIVTKLINGGARLSMDNIDRETEAHVVDILDYYEFLCDLYAKDVVDRKTIVQLRGRLMRRTWQVCAPYIRATGKRQEREIYSGFKQFVENLEPDDSPVFIPTEPRTLTRRLRGLFGGRSSPRSVDSVRGPQNRGQGSVSG